MATKLAKDMVTKYGMSKELGPLSMEKMKKKYFLGRSD